MNWITTFTERRERNLQFLQRHYPTLHKQVIDTPLTRLKINLLEANKEVDLWSDGHSHYAESGHTFAEKEVDRFSQTEVKRQLQPLSGKAYSLPTDKHYTLPRFFYRHGQKILKGSPLNNLPKSKSQSLMPNLGHQLPLLVVFGAGLGFHIEMLMDRFDIHELIIYEHDIESFTASLYTAEYEKWFKSQSAFGKSFNLYVGNLYHIDVVHGIVWNHLIRRAPLYPVASFFYRHGSLCTETSTPSSTTSIEEKVITKILSQQRIFLESWGSYDDEINQIHQGLYNLRNGVNFVGNTDNVPPVADYPIIVVGSAPSLDQRIDQLRSIRDRAVVVSCGSSITVLKKYGIVPDIHVELESDYLTAGQMLTIDDPSFFDKITIIATLQVNPVVFTYFKNKLACLKQESSLAAFGFEDAPTVELGAPSATNFGTRVAIHLGFKHIYLFGMDLGTYEDAPTHSKSVYYEERANAELKAATKLYRHDTVVLPGVKGDVHASPFLRNALFQLESLITVFSPKGFRFYSCSDGAVINGSQWISDDRLLTHFESGIINPFDPDKRKGYLNTLLESSNRYDTKEKMNPLPIETWIEKKIDYFEETLKTCCRTIQKMVESEPPNKISHYTILANGINHYIEDILRKSEPLIYQLLNGSIRRLLHIGMSHTVALEKEADQQKFLKHWSKYFIKFLNLMPTHFRNTLAPITQRKMPNIDHLSRSIYDPEPELDKYCAFTE